MANIIIGYSCCPLTRAAFAKQGHDAYTADLLPARDNTAHHLLGDVWQHLPGRWDFVVFHPMCTYLTVSAAWAFKDPDFDKYPGKGYHQRPAAGTLVGKARRDARDLAVAEFERLMALPFPAVIENPALNFVSQHVGSPTQIIQPHQFGDDASKATGLWHNHAAREAGLPTLRHTNHVPPRMVAGLPRWANQTDGGQNRLSPSADRWLERSATYPGIAAALGHQYGQWLNKSIRTPRTRPAAQRR